MQPLTIESLRNIINNQMESDFPDELLAALKEKEGKRFDKRIVDFLKNKFPDRNIYRGGVTSYFESITYDGNRSGITIYYYSSDHVGTINTKWIEEHNVAYFKARRERNAGRLQLLNSPSHLALIVDRHNTMIATYNIYVNATKAFTESYSDFDGVSLYDYYPNKKS